MIKENLLLRHVRIYLILNPLKEKSVPKRKRKIPTLDLHGVRHENVEKKFDNFIFDNKEYSGNAIIITGKSNSMKQIVVGLLKNYSFDKIQISDIINTGYIKICF